MGLAQYLLSYPSDIFCCSRTIAVFVKASKLTARGLAYVVRGVGRKIAKHRRAMQTPIAGFQLAFGIAGELGHYSFEDEEEQRACAAMKEDE